MAASSNALIGSVGREGEGIQFYLLKRNLAVELFGQLFDRHGADDGRQDEKTGDGVEQQQSQNPEQELVPPRRKGIQNAKFYLVTHDGGNLRVMRSEERRVGKECR